MGRWLLAVAALNVAGCSTSGFACQTDAQCGSGQCEASGGCSFPDSDCDSGRRFGEFSPADLAGFCVPVQGDSTAGSTSRPMLTTVTPVTTTLTAATEPATTGEVVTSDSTASVSETTSDVDPIDPDLLAWFPCDDDPSRGIVDASGNGFDARCDDCPTATAGIVGGACLFDGVARGIIDSASELAIPEFTIAAWGRADDFVDSIVMLISKPQPSAVFDTWELYFADGRDVTAIPCAGGSADVACNGVPVDAGWHHLAVTFDGTVHAYVDGVEFDGVEQPSEIFYEDGPAIIGGDIDFGEPRHGFVGPIDDIRIYTRALAPEEIATLAE